MTTDGAGHASVTLEAGDNPVSGYVRAAVGFQVKASNPIEVIDERKYLKIDVPVLVGDDLSIIFI